MIKDTACENCPFKEQGFKECPNYIETIWNEKDDPQPHIVRDCAPRRSLLMLQELYNRCYGIQGQINQAESEVSSLRANFSQLLSAINHAEENRKIEQSSKAKLQRHLQTMKYCEPEKFMTIDERDK